MAVGGVDLGTGEDVRVRGGEQAKQDKEREQKRLHVGAIRLWPVSRLIEEEDSGAGGKKGRKNWQNQPRRRHKDTKAEFTAETPRREDGKLTELTGAKSFRNHDSGYFLAEAIEPRIGVVGQEKSQ